MILFNQQIEVGALMKSYLIDTAEKICISGNNYYLFKKEDKNAR